MIYEEKFGCKKLRNIEIKKKKKIKTDINLSKLYKFFFCHILNLLILSPMKILR